MSYSRNIRAAFRTLVTRLQQIGGCAITSLARIVSTSSALLALGDKSWPGAISVAERHWLRKSGKQVTLEPDNGINLGRY
jgi:hypothetical protein